MIEINITDFIPKELRQQAQDALVDFVSDQAKKYLDEHAAEKIKKLRTDGAFRRKFDQGLERALKRFIDEYYEKDEDLVEAITEDTGLFKNPDVKQALMTMVRKPGSYLIEEGETLAHSFESVLPRRRNRERVNKAMMYLMRCLVEELWHLPELLPVYSLQFQKLTAEAAKQQVEIQKVQLQALTTMNHDVKQALLQLTDAIGQQKSLPALTQESETARQLYHNLPNPEYGKFIGRENELEKIHEILKPYPKSQHSLVTIDGIGGIGKSALALETAHHYLRNYAQLPEDERFDAIIWTSAKRTILTAEGIKTRHQILNTLEDIYSLIAVALQREDITRARPEEQAEVVRHALTRQRTLLIIDNLETVDDETVMTFLHELPAPTKAIVTTRHRIDVAYPVRLVGMLWEDAHSLIEQECNKKDVTLTFDEAQRLYKRTGGVPLAILTGPSEAANSASGEKSGACHRSPEKIPARTSPPEVRSASVIACAAFKAACQGAPFMLPDQSTSRTTRVRGICFPLACKGMLNGRGSPRIAAWRLRRPGAGMASAQRGAAQRDCNWRLSASTSRPAGI
jgi:hypothetical protein